VVFQLSKKIKIIPHLLVILSDCSVDKVKTSESLFKVDISDILDSENVVAEDSGSMKCEHHVGGK
jgi:hypothetical protein